MMRSWLVFVRIQATIVVILLLAIILMTLANVIFRTWGPGSITWADEFARITFVMFSFLAAALACAFNAHLVVEGIIDKTVGLLRRIFSVVQTLVAGVFFTILIWIGINQVLINLSQKSPAINFPVSILYAVVALSGLLMLVNSILATKLGAVNVQGGHIVIGPPDIELEEIA